MNAKTRWRVTTSISRLTQIGTTIDSYDLFSIIGPPLPYDIMGPNQPIPPAFTAKKNGILASLAAPESSYTDLSPKGSVDEAIKPLIERINALQGVITTSSCAGRVSVFLEGSKDGNVDGIKAGVNNEDEESIGQAIVPGGKGRGGRWLFVSHSPVHFHTEGTNLARRLGMCYPQEQCEYQTDMELSTARLARFQFEPMV